MEIKVYPEDWVPPLTAEEAERAGLVLVQRGGAWFEAHTVVDPETQGVYAEPKDGAKPIRIEIV